ncbi:MAG: tRNA(Ile2) 2-agmatinylcytidine synthetase, partial [Candidatus Nitrosothermus koennekii]
VYEPTGLSKIAQGLRKGDKVRVGGGVRKASKNHSRVLNVEYIQILELAKDIKFINPLCSCGKRLKSAGKNKGYKCEYCNYKGFKEKEEIIVERSIKEGLYIPSPKAHRHLTKPLHRYHIKKNNYDLIENFIGFNLVIEE